MALDSERRVIIKFVAEKDGSVETVIAGIDGRARDLKGRFIAMNGAVDAFGVAAQRAGKKAETGFAGVAAQAKAAQASIKGAVSAGKTFVSGLKDVGLLGLGFSAVASAVREVVSAMTDLAGESVENQQLAQNLEISISGARDAFKGYVDDVTLARFANQAFVTGVVSSGEDFEKLARGVQAIAERTGQDSEKLLEQATTGIARKSAARLDDLGIILNQTKAEDIFAQQLGKTRKELTALEKSEAFQKVALDQIAAAGDKASKSIDGFAVTVVKGQVTLENAKDSMLGFRDSAGATREAIRALSEEDLTDLRFAEVASEGTAAFKRANAALGPLGVTLADVRKLAADTGREFSDLITEEASRRQNAALDARAKELKAARDEAVRLLDLEADQLQFQADLIQAGGGEQKIANQFALQALEMRKAAAEEAENEALALKLTRQIQLATAADVAAAGRGGGRGPDRQQRVLAAGEQRVAQLEQEARLASKLAESAADEQFAEEKAREAAQARIELEREALEATKARSAFARQERENELAALAQQAEVINIEGRIAARQREQAVIQEARDLDLARAEIAANEQIRALQLGASKDADIERERILLDLREQQIQRQDPQTALDIIRQKDELAQVTHDREILRINEQMAAEQTRADLAAKLAEQDKKRRKEGLKLAQNIQQSANSVLSAGQQFSGLILDAAIKDDEKRAKADMKARGVASLASAALSAVNAVASFASLNIAQGVAHVGAAAFATATGIALLSGRLPTGGAAGAGAAAAAPTPAPQQRGQGEVPTTPESVPGTDGQPRPQQGQQGQQGGVVVNIGELNANGAIDEDFAEQVVIAVGKVGFARETG